MKKLLFLLLSVSLAFASEYKVVFDLSSSNIKSVEKNIIKNIYFLKNNFKKNGDSLKVSVVISGGAYKYFIKDINNSPYSENIELKKQALVLNKKLKKLSDEGVVFEACGVGLKKRQISKEVLYAYVKIAPNKTFALIKWQNRGYAYIPVK